MAQSRCDFCGVPYVEWVYYCEPFELIGVISGEKDIQSRRILNSDTDDTERWAACHTCSQYVDRKDYFFLAQRVTRQQDKPEMFGIILTLFHEFERYRLKDRLKELV